MKKTKIAVYPGTFDPVTFGHIDIIERASRIFDKVIVAVAHNTEKKPLFTTGQRVAMVKAAVERIPNVTVGDFNCLAVDYVKKSGSNVMIRGLRMTSDFEYEFQMALTNRKLKADIETIFMMPKEDYSYLSSKLIKEVASLGADLSAFVPRKVEKLLKEKLEE